MDRYNKYINIFLSALAVLALIVLGYLYFDSKDLEKKWKLSEENVKAYSEQLSKSESKNRAFKLSVEQLEYFGDSIFEELNNTRKQLGIKDKQLKSLQYSQSVFSKTDTIVLKDTIFKDKTLAIDTILGDRWYKVGLGLYYPSKIIVSPEVISEREVIAYTRKETVLPPKKFWLLRLFQKKHEILQIDVTEKNPYIKDANIRYIEIIH